MSEELIKSQAAEISRLTALLQSTTTQLQTTTQESMKRRERIKAMKAEAEKSAAEKAELAKAVSDAAAERDAVVKERDEVKGRAAAAPDEKDAKIKELEGKVRERTHRDAFAKAAKELKLREDSVDDALAVLKYTPEGDEPDGERIKALIGEVLQTRPHWAEPAADAASTAPADAGKGAPLTLPAKGPGPGAERGGREGLTPKPSVESQVNARFAKVARGDGFTL
jgi:hypothetical protein